MAIALRATSAGPNSNATSTAISLPTGTTTGDVTIIAFTRAALYSDAAATVVTIPAGWTTLYNGNGQGACYRVYQAGDPTSITFTSTTSNWWESIAATYSGCDTAAPVDAFNACVATTASSVGPLFSALYLAPSVSPNWQNDQLLTIYTCSSTSGAGTFTPAAGLTQRAINTSGPSVVIADQALGTSNARTGAKVATWNTAINMIHGGVSVLLKTAGAPAVTPQAALPTWGTAVGHWQNAAVTSVTVGLNRGSPLPGDLVALFVAPGTSVAVTVTVAGYTQAALVNNTYLFTRTFQAGDADPVLTFSVACLSLTAAVCLRTSGTGGVNPVIDQTATAAGSGGASPFSATVPSLTPVNASEYLLAAWMVGHQNAATFTPPGTLTNQGNVGTGPSMLLMDMAVATTPTGSFVAQATTTAPVAFFGAIEMLVSAASPVVVSSSQARAMVLA